MGVPVARTFVLRARPAVACNAMLRMLAGSTWLCTSRNQRFGPIPFDDQGRVNQRKRFAVESHVNDGASNRYDCSH